MVFRVLRRFRDLSMRALVCMTILTFLLAPEASLANPRQQLAQKGYGFTKGGFVKSAENGNLAAVKLFIGAGMAVDSLNKKRVSRPASKATSKAASKAGAKKVTGRTRATKTA